MLLNRFSFLFFANTALPEPADLPGQPVSFANNAPSAASVIIVPGEAYRVYVPFTQAPVLNNLVVNLVTQTGTLIGSIGTVQKLVNSPHLVLSFSLNRADLQPGYYRLSINDTSGPLYSNRVWLQRQADSEASALFTWANTRAVGPIDYENSSLTFGYSNQLRLKCQSKVAQPDTSIEEYEQVTTGVKVPVSIKTHGAIPFTTPNTDGFGHEGWRTLLAHRKILLNQQPVSVKTGYTLADGVGTLATGSFELWDSAYSVVNRC